jgi:hypothetical protein
VVRIDETTMFALCMHGVRRFVCRAQCSGCKGAAPFHMHVVLATTGYMHVVLWVSAWGEGLRHPLAFASILTYAALHQCLLISKLLACLCHRQLCDLRQPVVKVSQRFHVLFCHVAC